MPKGLQGFQKHHPAFHKNKKGVRLNTGRTHFKKGHLLGKRFKKGQIPWNKGIKWVAMSGNNNPSKRKYIREKISKKAIGNKNGLKHGMSRTREYKVTIQSKRRAKKFGNGGCHTIGEWLDLKAKYNWRCAYCLDREPKIKLTQDHIIPISKGG